MVRFNPTNTLHNVYMCPACGMVHKVNDAELLLDTLEGAQYDCYGYAVERESPKTPDASSSNITCAARAGESLLDMPVNCKNPA